MTAFLLKERLDDNIYATIAGLRTETGSAFAKNVVTIRARGIFLNVTYQTKIKRAALYGETLPLELLFENGEHLRADFAVDRVEFLGSNHGEAEYQIDLKSVGKVQPLLSL